MSVENFRNFNLVTSWKPPFRCAVCEKTKFALNQYHRPFVLDCFHDVCEKCTFSLKAPFVLTCKLCFSRTKIESKDTIREILEPSHFLRGVLAYMQYVMPYDIYHIIPRNDYSNSNLDMVLMLDESKTYECNECTIRNTQYYCVQCNVPYCTECYDFIHKTARALKKHNLIKIKLKPIPTEKNNPQVCEKHKSICENFCKICQKLTCKDCIPINHSQHQHRVISLLDENKKYIKDLNEVIDIVKIEKKKYQTALKNFSNGIILFIMLNGKMPFDDSNLNKLWEDQKNKNYKYRAKLENRISSSAKEMVSELLEPNPRNRLNLGEIIRSKWIQETDVQNRQ